MKVQEIEKDEYFYKKGDKSNNFFFLLKGKIEILSESHQSDDFKFSKNVDEFEFFGLKSSTADPRHDYAKVVTDKCWVLIIDKEFYEQIVKKT
jgi:CRP-like cAMP-binding protein